MQELESFLSFTTGFKDFHDDKSFLRAVDNFLQKDWHANPSLLFSIPQDSDITWDPKRCRIIWNKSRLYKKEGGLSQETFIQAAFVPNEKKVRDEAYVCDGREFHVFLFGEENKQKLYLLLDLPQKN